MNNINKKHFILKTIIVVFVFLFSSALVLAQGPVQYTWEVSFPGLNTSQITSFGSFIILVIRWSYWLAVLFAFYKLVETGFKYMTSSGNASLVAFLSKSLKNVFLGLLILFGTFLILNTINPELTSIPEKPEFSSLPGFSENNSDFVCAIKMDALKDKASTRARWMARAISFFVLGGYTNPVGIAISEWLAGKFSDHIGSKYDPEIADTAEKNRFQSPDSNNAKSDIEKGAASAKIKDLYYKILQNPASWLGADCFPYLELGPIQKGHASQSSSYSGGYTCPDGSHRSCHQSGKAIDITAYSKDKTISVSCTKKAISWVKTNFPGQFKIIDETNISGVTPHIHVEEIDCQKTICN